MGLRIAVLQGVMDSAPIDQLSRRHRMSRQGIYDLVKRVNEKGIKGVEEEKHPGRPGSLTDEIAKDLKEKLIEPPMNQVDEAVLAHMTQTRRVILDYMKKSRESAI
jgi:transposase